MACSHPMGGCRSMVGIRSRAESTGERRSKVGSRVGPQSTDVLRAACQSRVGSRAGFLSTAGFRRWGYRPSTSRPGRAGPNCRCRCDGRRCRSCRYRRCWPDLGRQLASVCCRLHDPGFALPGRCSLGASRYCCSAALLHNGWDDCPKPHRRGSRGDNRPGSRRGIQPVDRAGIVPGPTNHRNRIDPTLQSRSRR